jgi:hypothetical protein
MNILTISLELNDYGAELIAKLSVLRFVLKEYATQRKICLFIMGSP